MVKVYSSLLRLCCDSVAATCDIRGEEYPTNRGARRHPSRRVQQRRSENRQTTTGYSLFVVVCVDVNRRRKLRLKPQDKGKSLFVPYLLANKPLALLSLSLPLYPFCGSPQPSPHLSMSQTRCILKKSHLPLAVMAALKLDTSTGTSGSLRMSRRSCSAISKFPPFPHAVMLALSTHETENNAFRTWSTDQ